MTEVCTFCKTISGRQSWPGRWHCHWKRPKGTLHPLIKGPWGCRNYFKPKRHYLVLAASWVSDQDVWGVYGCNFSWRFQWHHRRLCLTLTAGDITDILISLSGPHFYGVLVLVTGNKFIAGVVVTGDNCSPGSLSRAIIVHRCRCHRRWIYRRWRCHWR